MLPDGRTVTYGEVLGVSRRIAAKLVDDGVTPGDRVAMKVGKSPEAIALYLATLQIGAVILPLNPAFSAAETDYFLNDARPRVFVRSPRSGVGGASHGDSSRREGWTDAIIETLGTASDGSLLDADHEHTTVHTVAADDLAAILYTSGTTGRSKGAMLTHANLASNCAALLRAWEFSSEDRLIHALPIFHIHGLFVAANMTLTSGALMHFLPAFDSEAIIDLLPESTVLMGVPTYYTRLLGNERLDRHSCRGMRLFVSGSAPLLARDHVAFEKRTGHRILERYGMTETGINTTNPYADGPRKPGTVGRALPGVELRVVDRHTGVEAPPGVSGAIEVRGDNVFAGYWGMPERTASEFRNDGFFVTGDLGYLDQDGYLNIAGRDKDLVISGGFNIYPKEIEELIDTHPDVLESAVIGVPHPDLGEAAVAIVVPAGNGRPDLESILDSIAMDLARYKHPRAILAADALPRNVMGKVQKAVLREQHKELFDKPAGESEVAPSPQTQKRSRL